MTELLKHCRLCPRACGADRTRTRGLCGADATLEAARASLHFWEEPPISGKNGSGTVFFSHCSLGCVFCQNRQISRREAAGRPISVESLARTFLSLEQQGAHNINLVTGAHYAPHIIAALRLARAQGLHIPAVYNSSGYESPDTLALLDGWIDIYLPDYKYYSSYYAERYSHAPDYRETAVAAITEMVRQTGAPVYDEHGLLLRGTVIRHLMLPGLAGDTAQVLRDIAARFGDRVLVSLMRQYTPFAMQDWPELDRTITPEEYHEACALFRDLGLGGFFQQSEAVSESFIPAFDGTGLEDIPT
ncbi:radical SAM protein [Agathobaculum desmolans]|uniref:radical SAM protein n=1 Tax=Agathobaculum desmolans TaxID=39484 RepID=UPI0029432353|nr:radical SAM protein [Agathobaculum desmolans]